MTATSLPVPGTIRAADTRPYLPGSASGRRHLRPSTPCAVIGLLINANDRPRLHKMAVSSRGLLYACSDSLTSRGMASTIGPDSTVHRLYVGLAPCPDLLRQNSLVEQHPATGDDGNASFAGQAHERCLMPWTVDRVA